MFNQTSAERLNRIADASKLRGAKKGRWPKEIVREVCALRSEGLSTSVIAAATGISAMSIDKWTSVGRSKILRRNRRAAPAKQLPIKVFDIAKNGELLSFRLQWRQLEIRFRS